MSMPRRRTFLSSEHESAYNRGDYDETYEDTLVSVSLAARCGFGYESYVLCVLLQMWCLRWLPQYIVRPANYID
jgi:hypothetical protein